MGLQITAGQPVGKKLMLALLVSAAPLAVSPAAAQTAAPQAAAAPQSEAAPGDIVVTATKRSEALQNVPLSVQAVGGLALQQRQVVAFDDYAKLLPSVSFQSFGPGSTQLYFRGVSSGDEQINVHAGPLPAAGFYLDEIPLTTMDGAVDVHMYDIARIEALSGPQGTLYGASSLAGTLRVITNQPDTRKFYGSLDVEANKWGKGNAGGAFDAMINAPLSANAALRVVAFYRHDGGYIDNVLQSRTYGNSGAPLGITGGFGPINNAAFVKNNYNDVDTYGGRAALKVNLDENWTATPMIAYQNQKTHGSFLFDPAVGDLQVADFTPEYSRDHWMQAALTIQGKISDWDVVYAGGYFTRHTDAQVDYSDYTVSYDANYGGAYTSFVDSTGKLLNPTQYLITSNGYTKQTHELRVSSPASKPFRLTAGLFFQRQTNSNLENYSVVGAGAATTSGQTYGTAAIPNEGDDVYLNNLYRVDRDYAMFADASYDLMPGLTLDGGIRFFVANNSLIGFSGSASRDTLSGITPCVVTSNAALPSLPGGGYCADVYSGHRYDPAQTVESGETHKVNLSWKASKDKLFYFTYSTGFRPGGNNRQPGVAAYKPDTLSNFEVGMKTAWFNHRLRVNGAIFDDLWKGLQYGLNGQSGMTSWFNAGNARIKGVEGDFAWRIPGGLTFSGSGSYIDAKLTKPFCWYFNQPTHSFINDCSQTVQAPAGTRLPIQPRFKWSTTLRYETQIDKVAAHAQISLNHQSGTRSYLTLTEDHIMGNPAGFSTLDATLGGKLDNFTFEFFAVNLTDSRGILSINNVCAPNICGFYKKYYPNKPQQFGIRLGTKF